MAFRDGDILRVRYRCFAATPWTGKGELARGPAWGVGVLAGAGGRFLAALVTTSQEIGKYGICGCRICQTSRWRGRQLHRIRPVSLCDALACGVSHTWTIPKDLIFTETARAFML